LLKRFGITKSATLSALQIVKLELLKLVNDFTQERKWLKITQVTERGKRIDNKKKVLFGVESFIKI